MIPTGRTTKLRRKCGDDTQFCPGSILTPWASPWQVLFVLSFWLHWSASLAAVNEEARLHGGAIKSLGDYLFDSRLCFESFHKWQSEKLSKAVLVVI